MLKNRIDLFVQLPHASLDRMALKRRMDEINQGAGAAEPTAQ